MDTILSHTGTEFGGTIKPYYKHGCGKHHDGYSKDNSYEKYWKAEFELMDNSCYNIIAF